MADIAITAANVVPSTSGAATTDSTRVAGAGAALTGGQSVYLAGDNTWKPFDADGVAPANGFGTTVGVVCNASVASGQPVTVCTKDPSFTLGGTVNAGDIVCGSATPGGLTKTMADLVAGMFVVVFGIGIGSNKINLNPVQSGVAHA